MTKVSVAFGGIGSDAISDVPVRENAKRTSGALANAFSTWNCMAWL
jgi:hypothetical protein